MVQHLDQIDLSQRWRISPRTLEKWRTLKKGPPWITAGNRVVYSLKHIEAFENANLHLPRGIRIEPERSG